MFQALTTGVGGWPESCEGLIIKGTWQSWPHFKPLNQLFHDRLDILEDFVKQLILRVRKNFWILADERFCRLPLHKWLVASSRNPFVRLEPQDMVPWGAAIVDDKRAGG